MSRVFVSYSHDSAEHSERVLQLANALRGHGVDVELDRYIVRPAQGWPHWCEEQLRPESSDFVLMICTETYRKRVEGRVPADEGLGVFWEGGIIYNYLYDAKGNRRFIPVLLDGASKDFVPIPIRNHALYQLAGFDLGDAGYEALYRELTAQPYVTKPPLGQGIALPTHSTMAALPPRPVRTTFPIIAPSRLFGGRNKGSDLLVGREDELKALDDAWTSGKTHVITIVAWGGVGKTSLVAHWAARTLAKDEHGGIERYFDWSFYSQGTRTEGDATGADNAVSADLFVKEALEWFGDPELAASNTDAWQKGERLARLVAELRTLLVLDGLEPLQDAKSGEVRDPVLRALLRGLAADNRGLCMVTTRQKLPELNDFHETTAPEWELAKLSKKAGAELLTKLGVRGTRGEREQLAADVKGHALTLTLLGKYLAEAHGGDIRKRDLVSLTEADYEETSGHAFHVMAAYERWLEKHDRRVELAILRLLGLFDRPATPDCLAALRQVPAIPSLTDILVPLADAQWNLAVTRLIHLGLVEKQPWEHRPIFGYSEQVAENSKQGHELGEPQPFAFNIQIATLQSIDAHPLIREHFCRRIRETAVVAWRAAHSRLFEHLRTSVPYWPEGLDGLQPLYQAVAHGCQAGRYQETCDEVYFSRIQRGFAAHAFYSSRELGAMGADLAAVGCFFVVPWALPAPELAKDDQAWLLNAAAYRLRAIGRSSEAREPMRVSMERYIEQEHWKHAAALGYNLSELDLTLGDVASAVSEAEQSVAFADRSGDLFERWSDRCVHADALHQAGREEEARTRFEKGEALLRDARPSSPWLFSVAGFKFCDLLMADVERSAWHTLLECVRLPALSGSGSEVRPIGSESGSWSLHSEALNAVQQRAKQTLDSCGSGLRDLLAEFMQRAGR